MLLLADRNPAFRDVLQETLGSDLRVYEESELPASGRVLVLVADLQSRGLRGLTPAADLRARYPDASLVLLTFYDHHYQESQAFLDRIADAVILKPVDLNGLARTVRRLANRAQSQIGPGGPEKEER